MHDYVDIDLARHLADLDADEGMAEWMASKQIEQEDIARGILSSKKVWDWEKNTRHILTTSDGVPYTADDLLIEALDESKEARDAYAELMASPAAAKLRKLLAEHWAHEMWETRTHFEISAAMAAERESLNDY